MVGDVTASIAPVATIGAAIMAAANLGARLTGRGFVVFALASMCRIAVGLAGGETSLVVANDALALISAVGIWRWLGVQTNREQGAGSAKRASCGSASPTLFIATGFAGMPAVSAEGEVSGTAVDALVECRSARIS